MNNIILVDDDNDDVYFFKKAVTDSKVECNVSVFNDGDTLLTFIYEQLNEKKSPPPLIFLDLNLPKVSGIDVLNKLNIDGIVSKFAIVIYTTSSDPKDIEMAYDLGAKSYFIKQANKSDLANFLNITKEYWFNYCELPKVH
ncbi:response regulator [Psychrosphaera sp.]|nr:response regulator [Psychrosphaera sp.]